MYPGETPKPKIGPPSRGDHQPKLLSKRVTDRSVSASGPHAGRSPTLTRSGEKGRGRDKPRPLDQNQNWTGRSCHRFTKPGVVVAPVTTGKTIGTPKNQPPRHTHANKRLRMSEEIGTPDGGQRFDDLPRLSEKRGRQIGGRIGRRHRGVPRKNRQVQDRESFGYQKPTTDGRAGYERRKNTK
jgi:hypothetical protein